MLIYYDSLYAIEINNSMNTLPVGVIATLLQHLHKGLLHP